MKKLISLLIGIIAIYMVATPTDLGAQALRVLLPVQGGTGISTSSPLDIGKCIKVLSDSPFRYELASCGGIGSDPTIVQVDGAPQSVDSPTLNFTGNSFSLTESPADTFSIRVSTSTLGLLASSISDFVSTVRSSITEGVTGLTFTTGNLTLDSGYTIPTTTRAVNWDTAFGWGNHASQGYITDGNTNWDNSYNFITDGNTNWDNSYSFITDGNTLWDNSYGFITQGSAVSTTTNGVAGQAAYWTGASTLGTVATGTLTENALGIEFDNSTRGLFGGSATLSLTSGYTIPSTTRAVAWDNKGTGSVTSVDMSVPTGLTIANNPITTSGTLALSLTAGYTIPSTTRMVNHDTAFGWGNHSGLYDILGQATSTLGTHTTTYNHTNYNTAYSWGNHAGLYDPLGQATSSINLLTAGDGLTRTLNDFDCDTASGSIFGCLLSGDWNIFNQKVSTSSIDTETELETLLSDVTNVFTNNDTNFVTPNMVLSTGQTDEFCLTYESAGTTWEWQTCGTGGGGTGAGTATTTDNNAEIGELITYTSNDFYIGGSASNTAEFNFDKDSSRLTISSTTALATGTIFSQASALRIGSSTGEQIEFNFLTNNTLKLFSPTGVDRFDFGALTASTTYASTTGLSASTICLSGDCKSAWPTGGGASSDWQMIGLNGIRPTTTVGIVVNSSSTINGALSVASSSYNYIDTLFSISTSTKSFGSLFTVYATTSLQVQSTTSPISNLNAIFGSLPPFFKDTNNIANLYTNGIMDSSYYYFRCFASQAAAAATADGNSNCGDAAYFEDTTGGTGALTAIAYDSNLSRNTTAYQVSDATAAGGAGLFIGAVRGTTENIRPELTPVRLDATAQSIATASSTQFVGFTQIAPTGTSFDTFNVIGSYFIASTTLGGNWVFRHRWNNTTGFTDVDTGVPSTTLSFMSVSMTAKNVVAYIGSTSTPMKNVYSGTNNIVITGGIATLTAGAYFGRALAGSTAAVLYIVSLELWMRKPYLINNY